MERNSIYLDNAATTLRKPPAVAQAVAEALGTLGNTGRGTYSSALRGARTVYDARQLLARLLGCPRAELVAFTSNATEALNTAINGLLSPGDHVITTALEHNSVLRPLFRLEAEGIISLSIVPADRTGCIDYDDFSRLLRPQTKAIVCTHASNLTGNVLDVRRICRFAHENGLLVIADASQTAGCYPVDMTASGVDVLCFTGHKGLMGPQGTGGLCVREGLAVRPLKVGGSGVQSFSKTHPAQMPTRLEAGTLNGHGLAGLAAAAEYILGIGVETIHEKDIHLARRFYNGVRRIPGICVYGDFSSWNRAAIVSLNIGDADSGAVSDALAQEYGIATRSGAHCAPQMHAALGTERQGAVRFSFSWYNTDAEVDAALEALQALAR
jgi:cysteine desulfurase family protein